MAQAFGADVAERIEWVPGDLGSWDPPAATAATPRCRDRSKCWLGRMRSFDRLASDGTRHTVSQTHHEPARRLALRQLDREGSSELGQLGG